MLALTALAILPSLLGIWLVGTVQSYQLARLEIAPNPPPRHAVVVTPQFEG